MTVSNQPHEQRLIDSFVSALRQVQDPNLSIRNVHNRRCKSRTFADLEFTAVSGQRWAIEAKYGAPSNIANEVRKLFGNLLYETGRAHRQSCKIGLLLHKKTEAYFRTAVNPGIPCQKFARFGCLVPVEAVFVFSPSVITVRTWLEFYSGTAGRAVR